MGTTTNWELGGEKLDTHGAAVGIAPSVENF